MMKSTMKRIVLTGAAVAVMMSFAAPAMAQPNVVDGGPGVIGPVVDPPPPPPPNPLCDVTPFGCGNNPDPVLDPGDNPVGEPPPEDTPPENTPPEDTPPENTPPPDKKDPRNEESDTSGSGGSSDGGSGGSPIGSASEIVDRGGTFMSSFLPTALTSTIGEAGNSVKENLPAAVAKSLPNTGGGWSLLIVVAAGLIAGAFLIRSIVRRMSSVTRTAQQ
jgi:LPXTG-motif cell wall-anchored protein